MRHEMSEIKSTLELVLERTRNMILSEEDRHEQALNELRGKLNGLLHRHLEGLMDLAQFERECSLLNVPSNGKVENILAGEISLRIDPHGENGKLTAILSGFCGIAVQGIEELLRDHRLRMSALERERLQELEKEWKDRQKIFGRAVRANLQADPVWVERRSMAEKTVLEEVKHLIQDQIGP